ncbi:T9SS type A sorting domain-containing protein [Dyadobacter sp. UP-52]|uniref:T9SS type A sorting domain-containing protein n=2 Tax=Dyadobacter subterraneus TaxID=2773304 RepID=A0ABR9WI69_9BACT|nr:T9SS type A sorting domain-containing protein [Dyadobacter subterraneus]
MKKIILKTFLILSVVTLVNKVQAQDVSINLLANPGSITKGTQGIIQVTVCNNAPNNVFVPIDILRPLISLTGASVTILGINTQTSTAGWTIVSNTGTAITLANTTATFGPSDCSVLNLIVSGDEVGGPWTVTGSLGFNGPQTTGNQTGNDNTTTSIAVSSALPVTLTSFTATKEGQMAQLKWSTTAETNSDRFEIERSQNGKSWDLIGTQKSNGESTTLKNYTFSDAKPLNGENLYRLKMIDKDATFAYSRIQSLTFAGDLVTSFYPNPVAEKLIIKTDDFSLVKNVKIFDANGRTVYQSSATPSSEINVQNLSAGLYVVQMMSKSGAVISHKVVKQ